MVRKRRTKTLAVLTSIMMAAGVILAAPSIPATTLGGRAVKEKR